MYYDIFVTHPLATREDTSDGVLVAIPGNMTAIVYAVSERPRGGLHCIVTEAQLQQMDDDNFLYDVFPRVAARLKNEDGSPSHVFNPAGIVYRNAGKSWLHRVNATEPDEIINGSD